MSPIHFSFRLNFQFTSTRPPSADTHDNLVKYTAQRFNYPAELLDLDNLYCLKVKLPGWPKITWCWSIIEYTFNLFLGVFNANQISPY